MVTTLHKCPSPLPAFTLNPDAPTPPPSPPSSPLHEKNSSNPPQAPVRSLWRTRSTPTTVYPSLCHARSIFFSETARQNASNNLGNPLLIPHLSSVQKCRICFCVKQRCVGVVRHPSYPPPQNSCGCHGAAFASPPQFLDPIPSDRFDSRRALVPRQRRHK